MDTLSKANKEESIRVTDNDNADMILKIYFLNSKRQGLDLKDYCQNLQILHLILSSHMELCKDDHVLRMNRAISDPILLRECCCKIRQAYDEN